MTNQEKVAGKKSKVVEITTALHFPASMAVDGCASDRIVIVPSIVLNIDR